MRFKVKMLVCQAVVHAAGGRLIVLFYTVDVSLPGFEYFRRILVVIIKYSYGIAAEF